MGDGVQHEGLVARVGGERQPGGEEPRVGEDQVEVLLRRRREGRQRVHGGHLLPLVPIAARLGDGAEEAQHELRVEAAAAKEAAPRGASLHAREHAPEGAQRVVAEERVGLAATATAAVLLVV